MTTQDKKLIEIPAGIFRGDEKAAADAAKKRRKELKKKLLEGKKVSLGPNGEAVTDDKQATIQVPEGKLAAAIQQWYQKNPELLEMEKAAMAKAWPNFTMEYLDDGRLSWVGKLSPNYKEKMDWYIQAVYNNNHPQKIMGSSVKIYLIEPEIESLIEKVGTISHLIRDDNGDLYLCTTEAQYVKDGQLCDNNQRQITSAASVIAMAAKWLLAMEMVLAGDLTMAEFNQHHGI